VGRRFHFLDAHFRIHIELSRDGFATDKPIRFDDDLGQFTFVVENRDPQPAIPHTIQMTISGLHAAYEVFADGKLVARLPAEGGSVALPIGLQETTVTLLRSEPSKK
jgi:hypothetical protein